MAVCAQKGVFLHLEMIHEETLNIDKLRQLVCEAAGCQALTPGDFYTITAFVENRTHETIGLTTVKRLWGYASLSTRPRTATLNVLARSIGYRSYEDFCTHYGDCSPSSNTVLGNAVKTAELLPGDRVMLRWNPGREITAEYLGNNAFRVVEGVASKLQVGDTFQAAYFALGHAAMLANVIHQDMSWPLYEIGQQGGLTFVRHISVGE